MKGLQEALRIREERQARVEKQEPDEDTQEKISQLLLTLHKGISVKIVYYKDFHYYNMQGPITSIDHVFKYLILGQEKIYFEDLYDLELDNGG